MAGPGDLIVGRDSELAEMSVALDDALRGHGRMTMLEGEPGIGKSRTAEELAQRAEKLGAEVLWGRCSEERGTPAYWPWLQVIRSCIANYETLVASAVRRSLRNGEKEAVPRLCDLEALQASTTGKIELEYAGVERSESELLEGMVRRATHVVFDEYVGPDELDSVVKAFDEGWQVEVSAEMSAADYLVGLDEIEGLRAVTESLAGWNTPSLMAAAIHAIPDGLDRAALQ